MAVLPSGTLTLLFTDIDGSTRLLHELGERYADVLAAHRAIIRAATAAGGGVEVDTQGDSFFIAFPRAAAAVAAAARIQREISAFAWSEDGVVQVRMGLHTGAPLRVAEGYVGIDLHRAARICNVGHGGQTLLSEETAERVRYALPEGARLRDLGARMLKDLPAPERLYQLVLDGLPSEFPPLRTLDRPPLALPAPEPLVGRDELLARLQALVRWDGPRVTTLAGPAGVGKTSLALHAAHAAAPGFDDGTFLVPVAGVTGSTAPPRALAASIGIPERRGLTPEEAIVAHLHDRRALLVFDGFGSAPAALDQVRGLLAACLRLVVLATARSALGLPGEVVVEVPPLALPSPEETRPEELLTTSAIQLFALRATAVRPDFALTAENALVVRDICARVEGLPLAIDLAAARTKMLPPRAILSRLDRRLTALALGARTPAGPRRALRATLGWSYHQLPIAEQTLLRRLSVFEGGITAGAVAAVCGAAGGLELDAVRGLASLAEKELLRPVAPGRFAMLHAPRAYAAERLAGSGEGQETRRAHARYFLSRAELFRVAGEPLAAQADWENLRAALVWSESSARDGASTALRLAAALAPYWEARGMISEGRRWLHGALALPDAAPGEERATALEELGRLELRHGDRVIGRGHLEQGAAAWQDAGGAVGQARVLSLLAADALDHGAPAEACELARRAAAVAREAGETRIVAGALDTVGRAALADGDVGAAREALAESVTLLREVEETGALAAPLSALGVTALATGDPAARGLLEESLALLRAAGNPATVAGVLGWLSREAWRAGDTSRMRDRAGEWLALARALPDHPELPRATLIAGVAALESEDHERAVALFADGVARAGMDGYDDYLALAGCLAGLATLTPSSEREGLVRAAHAALEGRACATLTDGLDRGPITALVSRLGDAAGSEPLDRASVVAPALRVARALLLKDRAAHTLPD